MSIKQKISKGIKSDSSVLIIGTLLSQLIPFILLMFLRRMYSTEEFGTLGLYFSILSIGAFITTLNYHSAITLPESDYDSKNLMIGTLGISFILNLIAFIVLTIGYFAGFIPDIGLGVMVLFLPLSIFINASHLTITNWFTRKREFTNLSINKVVRRTVEGGIQYGGHRFSKNFGLIIGNIAGDVANFIYYLVQLRKHFKNFIFNSADIKKVLIQYKNFPKHGLLPNLLNVAATYIPIFVIDAFFNTEITGHFYFSRQILAIPLALISTSISSVILQRYSQYRNEKKPLRAVTMTYAKPLIILAIMGGLVIGFFGEPIFTFMFGAKSLESGTISQIMIFYYLLMFLISPFSVIFIATERLVLNGKWHLFRFFTICLLFFLKTDNLYTFVIYLTVIESVNYLIYGFLIVNEIKKHDSQLLMNDK